MMTAKPQISLENGAASPRGWPRVNLRILSEIVPGRHIIEADHNRAGRGVPYLTGPSDFGELQAKATRWTEKPDVLCQPQDILVTVKGAGVAKLNFAPDVPTCIGRQLMAVRAKAGVTDSSFIYFAIGWQGRQLKEQAMGATVPGLSIGHLENLRVQFPSLAEQRRIAGRLGAIGRRGTGPRRRAGPTGRRPSPARRPSPRCVQRRHQQRWPRRRLGDLLQLEKGSRASAKPSARASNACRIGAHRVRN